jgi:hypothetical protein
MRPARSPAFNHGAALRTPPAHDARSWTKLWQWLGADGVALDEPGAASVRTPQGWITAWPGDWIILTVSGDFHVAAVRRTENGAG